MSTVAKPEAPVFAALKPWRSEPALREVVLLWIVSAVIFITSVLFFRPYLSQVRDFGDSAAYIQIANAIRSWNFSGITVKHFWGLPYAMASVSRLSGMSNDIAILLVSAASSLGAAILAYRLWGGWIALYALFLNFDWWQRSFLGGAEPLFVALLFASFLSIRKEHWLTAALFASLATITRPLGVFLLIGIGVSLLRRRSWLRFVEVTAIAAVIAFLYVLPLRLYLHDPLATVHSYGMLQSSSAPPLFGIPFRAIILGTLRYPTPLSNLLVTFGWIAVVLAGNAAMLATKDFRAYAAGHLEEVIFVVPYLFCVYAYNAPFLARGSFARFAIPIFPFVFLALQRWLPKDRRLLWVLAIVGSALAAFSAIGIRDVLAAWHA